MDDAHGLLVYSSKITLVSLIKNRKIRTLLYGCGKLVPIAFGLERLLVIVE